MRTFKMIGIVFITILMSGNFISCNDNYDDSILTGRVDDLENRVTQLEELCKRMNTNISSLQTIVSALQNNDYITDVTPVTKDGEEIGYTIKFLKSNAITIYHGKNGTNGTDGENGKDGSDGEDGSNGNDGTTPIIGVKKDVDNIYYWTVNNEWLLDENGNKIKAEGENGTNGSSGSNGVNGKTPKLKIEDGYWYVSYDNGSTWTELGKATGEDGKDGINGSNGTDGKDGDSFFQNVDTSKTDYVVFKLSNGTEIKLPTWSAFEQLQTLCNQMNTNINSLHTIIDALQNNDYIKSVTPIMDNGKEIGYTITFAKSSPITIYHGKDGNTPIIGVKKDTDGIYYWTVNNEWLLDENDNKIKAQGTDGANGINGSNGANGTNGKDGITPELKIEDGYWHVSYDNGSTWTELGKATGEDGKDGINGSNGTDGKDGDSFFQSVDTSKTDYVVFKLSNGTEIKLPTWTAFEQLQTLCNQMNTNINSLQTIIDALQNNDYIKNVTPVIEYGKQIGYTIIFAKSSPITIYHGKDGNNGSNGTNGTNGEDGKDGNTPIIGVKKDTDGTYYWTVNNEWLLDENDNKIKAQGTDGANGTNGSNGANGTNGKDGITPELKIEDGYWHVSYDNGSTWTELGKATGENGSNGDNIFSNVTQDENNVYFELVNGTTITISKNGSSTPKPTDYILFEDIEVKALCLKWDRNNDGELSYEEAAAVTTLGNVFENNTRIRLFKELQYFVSLTSLESSFYECTGLTYIKLPANVTKMKKTFTYCSSLKSIVIPDNVTELDGTFYGCSALSSIVIPDGVITIGDETFRDCSGLTSLVFPNSVTTIGKLVIFNSPITSVKIGDKVEKIGNQAFRSSSLASKNLASFYCQSLNPPSIDGEIFNSLSSGTNYIPTIYVPNDVVDAYKKDEDWKKYSSKIEGYNFNK